MGDQRFLHAYRITRGADFQRAYQRRLTAGDDRLLVFVYPNGLPHPRLGLSVSRKVGNAVVRNRWKHCIREAFRLSREQLPCGVDLVVIPRPDAVPETSDLQESLSSCAAGGEKDLTEIWAVSIFLSTIFLSTRCRIPGMHGNWPIAVLRAIIGIPSWI